MTLATSSITRDSVHLSDAHALDNFGDYGNLGSTCATSAGSLSRRDLSELSAYIDVFRVRTKSPLFATWRTIEQNPRKDLRETTITCVTMPLPMRARHEAIFLQAHQLPIIDRSSEAFEGASTLSTSDPDKDLREYVNAVIRYRNKPKIGVVR